MVRTQQAENTGRSTTLVVVGGDELDHRLLAHLPPAHQVICADGGLDRALAAGLAPTLVVGDFDSVEQASLDRARALGVPLEQHPQDKDATDTELALARALDGQPDHIVPDHIVPDHIVPDHIVMVGGGGDRLDHTLGALHALADPALAAPSQLQCWWGQAHITVLHGPRTTTMSAQPGTTVSLHAVGGPCTGITTSGLRWPLADATLSPTSSRGVSNVFDHDVATVAVATGVLFVIRPYALGAPS